MFIQKSGNEGGGGGRKKISKKKSAVHDSGDGEEPPSTPGKEEWIDVTKDVVDQMFGGRPEERAAFEQLGEMSRVC